MTCSAFETALRLLTEDENRDDAEKLAELKAIVQQSAEEGCRACIRIMENWALIEFSFQ